MQRRTPYAALAIALLACRPSTPAGDPTDLVLPSVTVIDGLGGQPVAARTIEIRNGAIVAIRPARPDDRDSLGVAGGFVIPGMFDTHMHLGQDATTLPQILDSLLRSGVTSVREMACCADLYRPLASEADSTAMPRIFYSAFWADPVFFRVDPRVSSTPGAGTAPWLLGVADTTDLPAAIRAAKTAGATGIKIYSNLGPATVAAIVGEAHAAGLRVWSHPVIFPTRPSEVIGAGVDVVSHAALLVWEGADSVPRRYNEGHPFNAFGPPAPYASVPPDSPAVLRVLEAMRDRGTILDATISTMRRAVSEEAYRWAVATTAAAHRMGVSIVAGTDREQFVDGYPAVHAELAALVADAGLSPLEAITAATANAARAVGAGDRLGSVEVGKLADLVVLDADPSTAIGNARRVTRVLKGGRVVR